MGNDRKSMYRILTIVITVFIAVIIIVLLLMLLKKLRTPKEDPVVTDTMESETIVDSDYVLDLNDSPVVTTAEDGLTEETEAVPETPQDTAEEVQEQETETVVTAIVTITGDNVRMRAEPNTDCDIVKTCNKGETYDFIEVVGDWTGVDNDGKECYIKTEFVEKTEQEVKQEDVAQEEAAQETAETPAADNADKAETSEAATGTVRSDGMVSVKCKDKVDLFTKAEYAYFVATWSYTGMADEMMTHHTAEELHRLYKDTH